MNPSILSLGIQPRNEIQCLYKNKNMSIQQYIHDLHSSIIKILKQAKYLPAVRLWYTHTVDHYLVINRSRFLLLKKLFPFNSVVYWIVLKQGLDKLSTIFSFQEQSSDVCYIPVSHFSCSIFLFLPSPPPPLLSLPSFLFPLPLRSFSLSFSSSRIAGINVNVGVLARWCVDVHFCVMHSGRSRSLGVFLFHAPACSFKRGFLIEPQA